ncbi:hypothetical protein OOZ63_04745 [Paucibacter sp. PLA-PC-4]|uniref:hypothetical protein n=1 Tax=Paucibacter sp. PLA-PC-4 TaxID=2993655 RepID=UPI0022493709|nr:hypothetical protein [Paucibacter sp. PLA-PC-4]MCX2861145.1 hypothetical protein [Paucibacter sp. PLA-PC-4]
MTDTPQVSRTLNAAQVLAQFKQASEQLFRRRLPADMPALGVESAMPGLEVSESSWDAWEALLNKSER